MKLRLFIDGVTFNQAMDLLLDLGREDLARQRHSASISYERALAQLITTAVFADVAVFDRNIVISGGHTPAAIQQFTELVNERGAGLFAPVLVPGPASLLAEPDAPEQLSLLMSRMNSEVFGLDAPLWRDYIARDCAAYLGVDPSLANPRLKPLTYAFRRDFFVTEASEPLVRPILEILTDPALAELRAWASEPNPQAKEAACEQALNEFCRRAVFAHLLIGLNALLNGDSESRSLPGVFSDFWPCPTRERVFSGAVAKSQGPDAVGITDATNLILPYVLVDVLRIVERIDIHRSLADAVWRVRKWPEYEEARRLLRQARAQVPGAAEDLACFADEIIERERSVGKMNVNVEPTFLGVKLFSVQADARQPVADALARKLPPPQRARWAASKLVYKFGRGGEEDARRAALRRRDELLRSLFPNTFR